jgi:hypothetical protein
VLTVMVCPLMERTATSRSGGPRVTRTRGEGQGAGVGMPIDRWHRVSCIATTAVKAGHLGADWLLAGWLSGLNPVPWRTQSNKQDQQLQQQSTAAINTPRTLRNACQTHVQAMCRHDIAEVEPYIGGCITVAGTSAGRSNHASQYAEGPRPAGPDGRQHVDGVCKDVCSSGG